MSKGTLYLLPTGLGGEVLPLLPPATLQVLSRLDTFIAENAKSARAFLKMVGYARPLQSIAIETLDEHTPAARTAELLAPLARGSDCALLSEAGCPAVADPGAALVRAAHAERVRVVPLVGPSAILLALMASGLDGQRFTFHGYLPVDRAARAQRLADLERRSASERSSQIFIEAPYRNDALLETILESCREDTLVCVGADLTLESEYIRTAPVKAWKRERPALNRRPTVFLLYRDGAPTARPLEGRARANQKR
jgi:16S rRNA (cytidine1402-2'-O)-methyltransferase